MSKASSVQVKKLLSCMCCITIAIITVKKRVMGDTQCKMVEEWDQNYITSFLFAVETANYFHQHTSTQTTAHPEVSSHPNYCRSMWRRWHVKAEPSGGRWLLQWTAGLQCWRFHLLQHMGTNVSLAWRGVVHIDVVCVCMCLFVPTLPDNIIDPQMQHCPPAHSKSTLQNANSKNLVFFNECTSL